MSLQFFIYRKVKKIHEAIQNINDKFDKKLVF